jgi:multicomponent Na+:H+ antiporter subunit D
LHAVAVVKAGAFGMIRVVYDVYGVEFAHQLNLLTALGVVAAITIIYGSVKALTQDNLKKRLAYSTVSQVSYIALGIAIFGPIGTVGGVVHLVHQGIMKITLFFTAGNYAETLGIHKISEMNGVGRRMPATTIAFSIAALGMIGIPPVAGFVSKWYLGLGALEAGMAGWVIPVLITSSLLNAAYFLPILYRAWFREPGTAWPEEHIPAARFETSAALLWPPIVTAGLALAAGLFASAPYSPLEWARLIAQREYGL